MPAPRKLPAALALNATRCYARTRNRAYRTYLPYHGAVSCLNVVHAPPTRKCIDLRRIYALARQVVPGRDKTRTPGHRQQSLDLTRAVAENRRRRGRRCDALFYITGMGRLAGTGI